MFDKIKKWLKPNSESTAPIGKVDKNDLKKVTVTAILTGVAAGVAYFVGSADNVDLGSYGPLITAVLTIALDLLRRTLQNNADNK